MLQRVLPRVGYAAVGLLWITIGILAARVGFLGSRDNVTGMPGALRVLLSQKEGRWLLGAVAVGLAAFALWRAMQAIAGREGFIQRISQALVAIGYATLSWTAVQLLLKMRREPSLTRRGVSWLLETPAGRLALQTTGVILLVAGVLAVAQGVLGRLPRWIIVTGLASTTRRVALRIARVGLASRGVVMIVSGYFVLRSVKDLDPREVHEIGGSLSVISRSPLGPLAMAVVAVGLISYGVAMWLLVVSRRPV